jgi:hypothetical protein
MTSIFFRTIASVTVGLLGLLPALAESKGHNGWSIGLGLQQSKAHVIKETTLGDYDSKDDSVRPYLDARYRFVFRKPSEVQVAMSISLGTRSAGGFLASGTYSLNDTMLMSVAPGI